MYFIENLLSNNISDHIMAQETSSSNSSKHFSSGIAFTLYLPEKLITVGLSTVVSFGLGIVFTNNLHQNQVQHQNVTCLGQGDFIPQKTDNKIKLNIQMEKQSHSN
jgi:hypothetical protein